MADHVIFRECSDEIKKGIGEYWLLKSRRVARLLPHFPEDQRHLRLDVCRHPGRYDAHVALRLPTGTLAARADAKDYPEALDIVTDRLVAEMRRHRELIRHDDAYRRRRHRLARERAGIPVKAA
jgi:ribosome-associated translation inhibitor RaiA